VDSKLIWYSARASGIVSWSLLAASVVAGLAMTSRVLRSRARRAWILDLHRFLGMAALVFLGIHVVSILLDSYVHFGLVEVLVPFTGAWHPVAVAWGIAGFYLLCAVELTSVLRSRLPRRLWRSTHVLAFPLYVVTTVHGLTAGTDRHSPVFEIAFYGMSALIALLLVARLAMLRHDSLPDPVAQRPDRIEPAQRARAAA